MDLRCDSKILHGKLDVGETIEVKCRSNRCGHGPGVVVVHRFSVSTGELQETLRFKQPAQEGKD